MPRSWQVAKCDKVSRQCEDCEVVPAAFWCDSCSVSLCGECDLQCHHPKSFGCSHQRMLVRQLGEDVESSDPWYGSPDEFNGAFPLKSKGSGGLEDRHAEVKNGACPIPISPSRESRKNKKKSKGCLHNSTVVNITGHQQVNHEACTLPETRLSAASELSRSASVFSAGTSHALTEDVTALLSKSEDSSPSDERSLSRSPKSRLPAPSTSLPSPVGPKSALRGAQATLRLGTSPRLHVQWAPDVREPTSSMISHTVGLKQHRLKKDQKLRHKGKNVDVPVSGKSEKRRRRKARKEAQEKEAIARQLRVGPSKSIIGLPEGCSATAPVLPADQDVENQGSITTQQETEHVFVQGSWPSSSFSSDDNSDPSDRNRCKEDTKVTEADVLNILEGKSLLKASEKSGVFGGFTGNVKPCEASAVNGSLLFFGDQSVQKSMKCLRTLRARKVIPAGSTATLAEASGYSQKAVACMVHAAHMISEEEGSGAIVEFEASARLFRLAEKTARLENTAESEIVAKHALRGQVMAWVAMATLYAKSDEPLRAEKCHLSLLQACQGSGMKLEAGMCLLDEGQCQLKRGKYKRAQTFFQAGHSLLEAELQSNPGKPDVREETGSYASQLREILVKAGRLAGVAAFKLSDLDVAKMLLLGALVAARRLHMKSEEARCLRLLAELQKGTQHLSSLQAAADAMSVCNLPYEHAEALFCLGSCKVTLHLNTLHSTSQGPRDYGLIESAKRDLEKAMTLLGAPQIASATDDHNQTSCCIPTPSIAAAVKGTKGGTAHRHPRESSITFSERMIDKQYMDSAGSILLGRLYEALGRTSVLMGEFPEARTYFGLALKNVGWAGAFQDAAKKVETLLDTLHTQEQRTCLKRCASVDSIIPDE